MMLFLGLTWCGIMPHLSGRQNAAPTGESAFVGAASCRPFSRVWPIHKERPHYTICVNPRFSVTPNLGNIASLVAHFC